MQLAPTAQSSPQPPQFAGSAETSEHPLAQATWPAGHSQTPALQIPPGGQAVPQSPQ